MSTDITDLQSNNNSEVINTLTASLNGLKTKFESIYMLLHDWGTLNSIYRGKNLGIVTADNIDDFISAHKISSGKFEDIYIGDYISINCDGSKKMCIVAGFNWCNGFKLNENHIVMVARDAFVDGKLQIYPTGAATGGFVNSIIYKTTLPSINTKLKATFGSHLLTTKYELLSSELNDNGKIINTQNCSCKAILMSEREVYGTNKYTQEADTDSFPQLPLFRINTTSTTASHCGLLRNIVDKNYILTCGNGYNIFNPTLIDISNNITYGSLHPRFCIG